MKILEFGDKGKRKIILIHGFQSPYQVWAPYIEHYKEEFHLIVPIMPGHYPNHQGAFISFDETARELEDYVLSHYGEEVFAVCGMSMGGVLAATIWQNQRIKIENLIFDGSPLVSFPGIVRQMMLQFYLNVTHKSQQRDEKTLRQAVGSIITAEHLDDFLQVLDNMSDTTITNAINGIGAFRLSGNIDAKDTKIYFYHGTAPNEMLARKTAKYIGKHYPHAVTKCFAGKGHCEVALFQPEQMIAELDKVLR